MNIALLWEKKRKKVFCNACIKHCSIEKNKLGYCKTRINKKDKIYSLLYGNVTGLTIKNIEEIPLFHFLPSTKAVSLTTATKDLIPILNKEWVIGQRYLPKVASIRKIPYEKIVKDAFKNACSSIVFDYIESSLSIDYAYPIARLASRYLIKTVLISNGFMSYDLLRSYSKYLDAFIIFVKASLDENFYNKFNPLTKNIVEDIKENIATINKKAVHLEVCNLIIPKIGDSPEKCRELAEFLVDLNPDIPLHLIQFYPDENFPDIEMTPVSTLETLLDEAIKAGLRYVYLSNIPESKYLSTYCYNCQEIVIKRIPFKTVENLVKLNRCPYCGFKIKLVTQK